VRQLVTETGLDSLPVCRRQYDRLSEPIAELISSGHTHSFMHLGSRHYFPVFFIFSLTWTYVLLEVNAFDFDLTTKSLKGYSNTMLSVFSAMHSRHFFTIMFAVFHSLYDVQDRVIMRGWWCVFFG